jgi:dTDP-4-dehydrorhamnose reductase
MRLLIFGKHGQLGRELWQLAQPLGEVTALDIEDLDLCDGQALQDKITQVAPHVILNAAAYTAVDRAEQEPEPARQINAVAPGIMAKCARKLKALLVHYSTDYVFDGKKGRPYTEEDAPNPINTYGQTKLDGEQAVLAAGGTSLILRTSWVYSLHGEGFVTKVLRWSRQQETLRIVNDQVGSPTWAVMLAQQTLLALQAGGTDPYHNLQEKSGIYHLAGSGSASRYEWAQAILAADPHAVEQVCTRLEPASSAEFPTPARRPACSALDCDKVESSFNIRLPDWKSNLGTALSLGMDTRADK